MQTGNDWENLFLLLAAMMSFDGRTQDTDKVVFETAVTTLQDIYTPHIKVSPQSASIWFENHRKDIVELVREKEDAERVLTDILERLAPVPVKKDLILVLMEIAMSKKKSRLELDPIMDLSAFSALTLPRSA